MPRGVVYLDGLGDFVDVQTPLSKMQLRSTLNSTHLVTYFIVVTTFERCVLDYRTMITHSIVQGKTFKKELRDGHAEVGTSQLLKIRWLRLIVDEGHELGKGGQSNSSREAAQCLQGFVSNIAAERRSVH